MEKKTETNDDEIFFTSHGLYKIKTSNNNETIIISPDHEPIAYISEGNEDSPQTKKFNLRTSFLLQDGTEIYFFMGKNKNSTLEKGIYVISDETIYHLSFNKIEQYNEIDLSAPEFDSLYIKEQEETKQYFYDDSSKTESWILMKTYENLGKMSYESIGNSSLIEERINNKKNKNEDIENISFEDKKETLDEETLEIYNKIERLKASNEQKARFFEYYFEEGVEQVVLKIFTKLIENKVNKIIFDKLDDYVKEHHCVSDSKTAEEEEKKIFDFIGIP